MAASTVLSVMLSKLLEDLVEANGKPPLTPMAIYAVVLRARDEAVCLEARASDRDTRVHALLAELAQINAEITDPAASWHRRKQGPPAPKALPGKPA